MSKIIVVGSSNTDMVVHTSHLPAPGETILGGKFLMNQGGKGANQAVAVKRLGGDLLFVARVGNDVLGQQTLRVFQNEGIETSYIALDNETPSGVALISVDQYAENCIVVASGANMLLGQEDIDSMEKEMLVGDILLMQLEIPLSTVEYAARKAYEKGVKDLKVDMKTQTITVTFREDKNTTENLQKAIEKLNIEVKGIEESNTSAKTQAGEKCEKSCCEKEGKTK